MGKGGDNSVNASVSSEIQNADEVIYNGRYYNTKTLKHPGGNIIKFYAGKDIDCTEAFDNFHVRSKKAKKLMDSLPSRAMDTKIKNKESIKGQNALLDDYHKLTDELHKEGLFKPNPFHVLYRCLEIIVMHAIGFWVLFGGANQYGFAEKYNIIAGLAILGLTSGRCGWLMHEGGHYSLTGNINIDRMLQIVIYGVGCGMSGSWWRNQHNKHHATPQKLGHDGDLRTLPLVAFTTKVCKRLGLPMKLWIRLQAFMFPIITTVLVASGWQFFLHPRHILRTKNFSEAVAIIVRYVVWYHTISAKFGLKESICKLIIIINIILIYFCNIYYLFKFIIDMYFFYNWFAANYIFINFAVSHTHLPVIEKEDTTVDWVRYSAIYTMNVSPGPFKWVNWWMSFLNFQIEHHLWPSIPQYRFPAISPRVKALFEKHGLKYDQRSYVESIKVTFENLHNVGSDVFLG